MGLSYVEQEYDGTNNTITLPFKYIKKDDIYLYINEVPIDNSNFTWVSDYVITVTAVLTIGDKILIKRFTDFSNPIVDYQSGNILTEANLDLSNIQHLYHTQELLDLLTTTAITSVDPLHNHDERYYTKTEIGTLLAGTSLDNHNHDDLYYRKFEVDGIFSGYYYTKIAIDNILNGYSSFNNNNGLTADRFGFMNGAYFSVSIQSQAYPTLHFYSPETGINTDLGL